MILAVCLNPAIDSLARIPALIPGRVHRMLSEERYPGGKGVHVALASAELGEPCALLGVWAGPTGIWIRERCRELGVQCFGPEVPGWNRICYAFRSESEFDETELLGTGPELPAEAVEAVERNFAALLPRSDVVVLSGSLPAAAPADLYARLTRTAAAARVPCLLDATGEPLRLALTEKPFGIHLNRDEAGAITGAKPAQALPLLAPGSRCVALTAGRDGLYLLLGSAKLHANVTIERSASAVGSGDCLTAGLAVALRRRLGPEESARLAVSCGAANCLRPELGMLHRRDVESLVPRVTIRDISGEVG